MIRLGDLLAGVLAAPIDLKRRGALEAFSGKAVCRRCGGHFHEFGKPPVFRLECVLGAKCVGLTNELFYHRARRRAFGEVHGTEQDHKAFKRREISLKFQKEGFYLLLRIVRGIGHFVRPVFVRVRNSSQTKAPATTQKITQKMEEGAGQ